MDAVRVLPVALVGLLLLVSAWWDGAFDLRYWAPLAILAVGLLFGLLLSGTLRLPRNGALLVSIAAIWGLAAYDILSAVWSQSPDGAWTEGARTAFYASLWTLALSSAARGAWRDRIGGALTIGVGAIAAVTLVVLITGGEGDYLAGRLDAPIGYRNATAALFAFAAWPLIGFAARRASNSGARALAFSATVLVLGLGFMTQSRGVLIGLLAGGAVSLAIGPDRLRRAWLAIAAVTAVAIVSGPLLGPWETFSDEGLAASAAEIRTAALALLSIVGVSFLVAIFFSVYDNGLRSASAERRFHNVALAGLVVVAILAAVVGVAKIGNPVSYAEAKLDEFSEVEPAAVSGSSRLGTVGGQRSDLWRVALDEFGEDPVLGAGAGSYPFAYYRERRTDRNLNDPHSLPLRVLSETGIAGILLLLLWLGAAATAISRHVRQVDLGERVWIAGLAAAGTTVLAQCMTDWLWLLPGLLGLAILALGLAASGARENSEVATESWTVGRAVAAGAALAALVSLTFLFLGDLYTRQARSDSLHSTEASLSAARTAGWFNPVSVTPHYLQASALESMGQEAKAKRALEEALDEEPDNFVTLGLLGDFEVRAGHPAAARAYYRRALALNPLDTGLQELSRAPG